MSIIFGIRAAGEPVNEGLLEVLSRATTHFAPDGTALVAKEDVGMGYQPFYTHERSLLNRKPAVDKHGNLLALDGRIDNYRELEVGLSLSRKGLSDSEIILAAFERWGDKAFSQLTGDWALAFWSPATRSLYLARDHAGTRSLFYEAIGGEVVWSSVLETLVNSWESQALCEEFIFRYLCCIPTGTFTPYKQIHAVPPGHYVAFRPQSITIAKHWEESETEPLRLASDAEYEQQFYALFQQAVARRTGEGSPVLAHLSGGMDSTAIVCMSDALRAGGAANGTNRIKTISFFDSSEPNWDEQPYVALVEARREKTGIHVDLSPTSSTFDWEPVSSERPALWPEDTYGSRSQPEVEHGFRAVLSGLGGDELLGGIPSPLPELGDFLFNHQFVTLVRRSLVWCEADRTSLIRRLGDVITYCRSIYAYDSVLDPDVPPWISSASLRNLDLSRDGVLGFARGAACPSAISFCRAWWCLLDTLPKHRANDRQRTEYRFPFLDRDLVEFLARVPRDQLLRPGRRRSLMRRALKHIMPVEILERRRKAFTVRRPVLGIRDNYDRIVSLFRNSELAERGYVDRSLILRAFEEFVQSTNIQWHRCLTRAIQLERWLQSFANARYSLPIEGPAMPYQAQKIPT